MVSGIQKEKAELFLKLHHDKEILVLANSWDTGRDIRIRVRHGFDGSKIIENLEISRLNSRPELIK